VGDGGRGADLVGGVVVGVELAKFADAAIVLADFEDGAIKVRLGLIAPKQGFPSAGLSIGSLLCR
jgi:hypothetical protein